MNQMAQANPRKQIIWWGRSALFFLIMTGVVLTQAFVSPRDGMPGVNNLQYLSHGEIIAWLLVLNVSGIAAGVSVKMVHQAEHPEEGVRPSFWYELAIPAVLGSVIIWGLIGGLFIV